MIKKYIKPTSTVYAVDLTKSLLLNGSGGETPTETPGLNPGLGGDDDDVEGEYSRQDNTNNGGNSIWDNVW